MNIKLVGTDTASLGKSCTTAGLELYKLLQHHFQKQLYVGTVGKSNRYWRHFPHHSIGFGSYVTSRTLNRNPL